MRFERMAGASRRPLKPRKAPVFWLCARLADGWLKTAFRPANRPLRGTGASIASTSLRPTAYLRSRKTCIKERMNVKSRTPRSKTKILVQDQYRSLRAFEPLGLRAVGPLSRRAAEAAKRRRIVAQGGAKRNPGYPPPEVGALKGRQENTRHGSDGVAHFHRKQTNEHRQAIRPRNR